MILRLLTVSFALLSCGCVTRIYDSQTGRKTFETYGDLTNVRFTPTSFSADRLTHSVPTRAAFNGSTSAIMALGTAASATIIK